MNKEQQIRKIEDIVSVGRALGQHSRKIAEKIVEAVYDYGYRKVVFCKDCRYCEERHYEEKGEPPYTKLCCKWSNYSHQPTDFCSLGERKE